MLFRTAVAAKPYVAIIGKTVCRVTVLRSPGKPSGASEYLSPGKPSGASEYLSPGKPSGASEYLSPGHPESAPYFCDSLLSDGRRMSQNDSYRARSHGGRHSLSFDWRVWPM